MGLRLMFNYPARGGRSAVKEVLDVDLVTSVDRTVSVSLTEHPTLIYGFRNNFCMDLGATEKVTFKCSRANPFPYSDSSSDPSRWSNGKWYRHLESLFDRWQNFGMNSSGVQTGGVSVIYTPEDAELQAPIGTTSAPVNAFLVGSLNPSFGVQQMTFSLPLQLATMKASAASVAQVTLTLKSDSAGTLKETVKVLKGYPQTVALPDGWEEKQDGRSFVGWTLPGGATISAGGTYTFESDTTLVAIWLGPEKVVFVDSNQTITVPSGIASIKYYLVGGGGGAGGSTLGRLYTPYYGGGGGSGDVAVGSITNTGESLTVKCGKGGAGAPNLREEYMDRLPSGSDGGTTSLYRGEVLIATAKGGSGGSPPTPKNNTQGTGGRQYMAGGDFGKSGKTESPNVDSNAGRGGDSGGGGGAAAFRYAFTQNDGTRVPSSGYYESKGGDGCDSASDRFPGNGSYGGGGGSGRFTTTPSKAGSGGAGCALILMFKGMS